jgi:uncharacterized membrane protein YhaH (DUF805 family)
MFFPGVSERQAMSDPHHPAGVARPQGAFWWLRDRAGRREYWAYVGALIVISLFLRFVPPLASLVGTAILAFVQVRRLHDFGRSGWWALGVAVAPLTLGVPVFFATSSEDAAAAVAALVTLGAIVWIGAVPGDPGDNRFGPAPPFSARRLLTGR